jgi:hypothetical protein
MNRKRRVARFYISEEVYLEDAELVQQIYSRCIPYRIEYLYHCRSFEVYATACDFYEVEESGTIPNIVWSVNPSSGVLDWS